MSGDDRYTITAVRQIAEKLVGMEVSLLGTITAAYVNMGFAKVWRIELTTTLGSAQLNYPRAEEPLFDVSANDAVTGSNVGVYGDVPEVDVERAKQRLQEHSPGRSLVFHVFPAFEKDWQKR
jgi:hypothetical protein